VSNPLRPGDFLGFCGPAALPSCQPTGDRGQLRESEAGVQLRRPSRRRVRPFEAALIQYA
jgi:hypothetical protein